MDRTVKCGCGSEMERGFVVEYVYLETKQQQRWVQGVPESSFWSGLKTSDRDVFTIDSYKCT